MCVCVLDWDWIRSGASVQRAQNVAFAVWDLTVEHRP